LSTERARIAKLRELLMTDHGPDAGLLRTIGDDAAVLAAGRDQLVISVDAQVEGTHFRPQWLSWADLGFRATMAAASDLAAMAAQRIGNLNALFGSLRKLT